MRLFAIQARLAAVFCFTSIMVASSAARASVTDPAATPAKPVVSTLPDAPSAVLTYSSSTTVSDEGEEAAAAFDEMYAQDAYTQKPKRIGIPGQEVEIGPDGKPIPLDKQQPKRILGFMPNFRSVSVGAKPHPPGWKYNFTVATHQAFDYSSFLFLGLTSLSAEGLNEHPVLGKGVDGFWAYTWRGFLDKTDGNYLGGWFLPSLLHEDTRYYPMGNRRSIPIRALYVISRQGVTRTYGGHQTPNLSGLGGKVLAQVISRTYYPTGATSFGVLAEKFGYSVMRDVAFTSIREFYPDIAAHYVKVRRRRAERAASAASAADVDAAGAKPVAP